MLKMSSPRRAADFHLAKICGGIVAVFIVCNLPRLAIGGFEVWRCKKQIRCNMPDYLYSFLGVLVNNICFSVANKCKLSFCTKDFEEKNSLSQSLSSLTQSLSLSSLLSQSLSLSQSISQSLSQPASVRIPTILRCTESSVLYWAPEKQVNLEK